MKKLSLSQMEKIEGGISCEAAVAIACFGSALIMGGLTGPIGGAAMGAFCGAMSSGHCDSN